MTEKTASASIQFFGHATVVVTSEQGKRVVIDPWFDGNPGCPADLVDPGNVDVICLTHGHSDHAASAVMLAEKSGATVFATYELAMLMIKEGVPEVQMQPMNKGGSVAVPGTNGLAVSLTHAIHSSSYDGADGHTYYAGEPGGIVITLESGRTIYHAGDTILFSDMKLIRDKFKPTVALLPIGDRFTMDPEDAAQASEWLKPQVVIPIHYGTFDILTGTPEQFLAALKEPGCKPVVLDPGGTFDF